MINMIASAAQALMLLVIVAVLIAAHVNYQRTQQVPTFRWFCAGVLGWLIINFSVLHVYNHSVNVFLMNVEIAFLAFTTLAFFFVVLQHFLPRHKLPKPVIVALFSVPSLTTLVAITSPLHSLLRNVDSLVVWPRVVEYSMGSWFFVHLIFSYTLVAISIFIILKGIYRNAIGNRASAIMFLFASVSVVLGGMFYMSKILPITTDPTSIGLSFAALILLLALSDGRYGLIFRMFNTLKTRITFPVLMAMFVFVILILGYVGLSSRVLLYNGFDGYIPQEVWAAFNARNRNLVLLSFVGLSSVSLLMYFMISQALKPLGKLAENIREVAVGNTEITINRSTIAPDEMGELTTDICTLADVIKVMVNDLSNIHHEYNELGNSNYRLDAQKYNNSFRAMVESINKNFDAETENILAMVRTLNQINEGDFDVQICEMPGDFALQSQAIRALVANMKNISVEVAGMVEAAAVKGDLEFHIDESKYTGDWHKIMYGLNNIADAVNAPIVEIRDVMANLSAGNFSNKVTGDYSGDFLAIRNAVNSTIETLAGYVSEISAILTGISKGDLTKEINRAYVGEFVEIKNSINDITRTLRNSMEEIVTASNYVSEGANRITANANELAVGSSGQAASLEELHVTVEQIRLQTQQFAENARDANTLSNKSTANAHEGSEAMSQMMVAMTQIKESSSNISKIIKVIQDIAFQTNLLALNASVEAARAGEHGRGFAVVADEVRNLAARSQTAASETTDLIQDSISRVDTGTSVAQITSNSLNTIVSSASDVVTLINNITAAANEQSKMIEQISTVLLDTASRVQDDSKFAHEAAATAEELNTQVGMLREMVRFFKM